MKILLKITAFLLDTFFYSNFAQHIFSIVTVDSVTGEIGNADVTFIFNKETILASNKIIIK